VLKQKLKVPFSLISELLSMLRQDTVLVKYADLPNVNIKDNDDLIIIASALFANAHLLVTGDKELGALGKAGGKYENCLYL